MKLVISVRVSLANEESVFMVYHYITKPEFDEFSYTELIYY